MNGMKYLKVQTVVIKISDDRDMIAEEANY